MRVTISKDGATKTVDLKSRTFRSGSIGYWGQTKLVVDKESGERYQVQVQAVLIGSRPEEEVGS